MTIENIPERDGVIIGGDFNAKIGDGWKDFPENTSKYGKGHTNSSGRRLLELCRKYDLVVTNTLFQHKLTHRTTWSAPFRNFKTHNGEDRRNPVRNQIDFIITRNKHKKFVTNSRSYGGILTDTDHKLVKANTNFNWPTLYSKQNIEPKTDTTKFSDKNIQDRYREELKNNLNKQNTQDQIKQAKPQERWNQIVKLCHQTGENILGKVRKLKHRPDETLKNLSEINKKIRHDIECSQDEDRKKEKQIERKNIKKKIRKRLQEIKEKEIEELLKDIESKKNDSNRYHTAVRNLNRITPKPALCVQDSKGNIAGTQKQQATFITSYSKEMLGPKLDEKTKEYKPSKMNNNFTAEEIKKAVTKMKNGKSTGKDGLVAEFIKYGPSELHQHIAEILNIAAETGEYPEELDIGILSALPKPGKPKGPCENLRPIILLCTLRKILTICLMDRCWTRIKHELPIDQAAYQPGRSTTEQVFSIKVLAEKAITSNDFEIHLLLIDMSKAFDTVNRNKLFTILEQFLDEDEMHLVYLLTSDPKLMVRVGKDFGDMFITTLGVMQGDCFSAILFILYLAKALKNRDLEDHFSIEPKYADDITLATTCKKQHEDAKSAFKNLLGKYNLYENASKRETYTIPKPPAPPPPPPTLSQLTKNQNNKLCWSALDWLIIENVNKVKDTTPDWRKCKLLGSCLDTQTDIARRKGLAIDAMKKLRKAFNSKNISIAIKMRLFNTYIGSIFLYNSELWTVTKQVEDINRCIPLKATQICYRCSLAKKDN